MNAHHTALRLASAYDRVAKRAETRSNAEEPALISVAIIMGLWGFRDADPGVC